VIKFAPETENDDSKYDSLPEVFSFEDHAHSRGLIGLTTNGNKDFYADNFILTPTPCILEADLPPIKYIPPTCNRYRENYKGAILQTWGV